MLEFDPERPPPPPRPAATSLLLRDGPAGIQVCVMQRSPNSAFMGGAIVFPGGRVDEADGPSRHEAHVVRPNDARWTDEEGMAARIAACRESLEEVGIVPLVGPTPLDVSALRASLPDLAGGLARLGAKLDLGALVPLSRWVTPEAEKRRYDARFFVARAPEGQEPVSDDHEAVKVFFAAPSELLTQADAGKISLFPPTHRTLELLARQKTVDEVLSAARATKEILPVCPRFVLDEGVPTLALPGDRLHEIRERRIEGGSRYVLRDARWVSEDHPG